MCYRSNFRIRLENRLLFFLLAPAPPSIALSRSAEFSFYIGYDSQLFLYKKHTSLCLATAMFMLSYIYYIAVPGARAAPGYLL